MVFFFFQAEDGIRDVAVTGVQTCALPISLAAEGARVMICARDPGALAKAAEEIGAATGRGVLTEAADLSDLDAVARVMAAAVSRLGRLDILVNNAGAIKGGDFLATPDEEC